MNNKKLIAGFVVFSLGASQGALAQVAASAASPIPHLDLATFQLDMDGAGTAPLVIPVRGGSFGGGFGGGRSSGGETFHAPARTEFHEAPRSESTFHAPAPSFHEAEPRSESTFRTPAPSAPRVPESRGSESTRINTNTGAVTTSHTTERGNEVSKTERTNGGTTERKTDPTTGISTTKTTRINPRTGQPATTTRTRDTEGNEVTKHSNGATTVRRADGSRITTSPNRRVEEKVTTSGNTRIVSRTTVINNVRVDRTYNYSRGYSRYGYYVYVPTWGLLADVLLFDAFVNPYTYYNWGWAANPWYYPGYFTPYPSYSAPYEWVTDAYIAGLEEARYEDSGEQTQAAPLSPDVKAQIAQQVKEEMASYQNKQPLAIDSTLKVGRIFTVHQDTSVTDANGNAQSLSEGDLIKLDAVADSTGQPLLEVVSSESVEAGTQFNMSLENLQKMNDKFAEDTEAAMEKMQAAKANGSLK